MSNESSPSDESTRSANLKWMTNSLPEFPKSGGEPWVWREDEIAMLRAACAKRFDETLRTESLFCIAATAIRIYLGRQKYSDQPDEISLENEGALRTAAIMAMTNFVESTFLMKQNEDGSLSEQYIPKNDAIAMGWQVFYAVNRIWEKQTKPMREVVVAQWQPIKTAPRNTWCLIFSDNATTSAVAFRGFADESDGVYEGTWVWMDSKGGYWPHATHWMPLPKTPEVGS